MTRYVYVDAPYALTYGGPGAMMDGCNAFSQYRIEPSEGGAVVKRHMRFWGNVPEEFETMMRSGTRQMFETSFRNYVESGIKFEGAAK